MAHRLGRCQALADDRFAALGTHYVDMSGMDEASGSVLGDDSRDARLFPVLRYIHRECAATGMVCEDGRQSTVEVLRPVVCDDNDGHRRRHEGCSHERATVSEERG